MSKKQHKKYVDAAEDVEAINPRRTTSYSGQEPYGSVGLVELLDTIQRHHIDNHPGAFRFCTDSVCSQAKYA